MEMGYEDTISAGSPQSDSENETDIGTQLTLDTYEGKETTLDCYSPSDSSCSVSKQSYKPRYNSRRNQSPESDSYPSEESEEDDDTYATMSTLTYSKINSIYGGHAVSGYHRGPMGGLYASKRVYTPRYNGRNVRQAEEYDDDETQMTMSTMRDDDTQATMSTLTYSKVGSLYGSNAVAGYHRGSMGGYYNRHVDAHGYVEEDDEWETSSRLTTSTFGIGTKPYRPQNYRPQKSYNRSMGGYYDRQFDSVRECSQGSETYDGDDDRDTTVTSYTATDAGSSIRGYL
jgi:hypothetical protein